MYALPRALSNLLRAVVLCAVPLAVAGCAPDARLEGFTGQAPNADAPAPDPLEVAHRLSAAGEHELALRAYLRAALDRGMTADVLTGMGSANLALGRLGQAGDQLRRATDMDPANPAAWNNYGVLLLEQDTPGAARGVFQHALRLSGGSDPAIRANLDLALARSENSAYTEREAGDYVLIRQGGGSYKLSSVRDGSRN